MTADEQRTGPARDVPPPRPVRLDRPGSGGRGSGWFAGYSGNRSVPAEEGPLGRAARAVADAVGNLLGGSATDEVGADGRRSVAAVLRDVVGAVAAVARRPAASGAVDEAGNGKAQRTPGALLGDLLAAAAPRLPIRDADRLRGAYPGLSEEQIADELVTRAARTTSAIGAATGGLSAAQWFAPPSLLAVPLELGAETVLVAGVEVVLVGELHELYGRPATGDARTRAVAYLSSWSRERAVEGGTPTGVAAALGTAGLRALRRRVGRRLARNLSSAVPFLLGAALGGRGNRKATENLGARLRQDLRRGPRAGGDGVR